MHRLFVSFILASVPALAIAQVDGAQEYQAPQVVTADGSSGDAVGGAFVDRIPIVVPEGREGIAPKIELNYNSQRGNGFVGVGWALAGLPAIQRMNWGDGINYNSSDRFGLAPEGWGGTSPSNPFVALGSNRYQPLANGGMDEYTASTLQCGSGPCYWTRRAGGLTYYFGGNNAANAWLTPTFHAAIWDRANPSRGLFAWLLYRVEDASGNYYEVTYANGYPDSIRYTLKSTIALNTREIVFERANRSTSGGTTDIDRTPAPAWFDKRLSRIVVRSKNSSNAVINTIRTYTLTYDQSPTSGRSRLTSVRECGTDGVTCMPAMTIAWQNGATTADGHAMQPFAIDPNTYPVAGPAQCPVTGAIPEGASAPPCIFMPWLNFIGDVNGDGRGDLVRVTNPAGIVLRSFHFVVQVAYGVTTAGTFAFAAPQTVVDFYIQAGNPSTGGAISFNAFVGDFAGDLDAADEVMLSMVHDGTIEVWMWRVGESVQQMATLPMTGYVDSSAVEMRAADINGDQNSISSSTITHSQSSRIKLRSAIQHIPAVVIFIIISAGSRPVCRSQARFRPLTFISVKPRAAISTIRVGAKCSAIS